MTELTESLRAVQRRIETAARLANREPGGITLLAVSKTHPPAAVRELAAAGQRHFGENQVQEALPKIVACADLDVCWHFIGRLQSNKTRAVADRFAWVHSVDRDRLARRLSEQRPFHAPPLQVCLQVRLGDEATKGGIDEAQLPALADAVAALPRLALRGLMGIPPPPAAPGDSRPWFGRLRELMRMLNDRGHSMDTLSMGMTADLEDAVLEGATIVRVGTAVFGPRVRENGVTK